MQSVRRLDRLIEVNIYSIKITYIFTQKISVHTHTYIRLLPIQKKKKKKIIVYGATGPPFPPQFRNTVQKKKVQFTATFEVNPSVLGQC